MMEKSDTPSVETDEGKTKRLHSILIHHSDDDDFFHGQMRPRANTDPISPRPRLHVTFDLPDIVVDDCSDNDEENVDSARPEEINNELRNTAEGAFFVFKSPPRQRSNTCPMNMFSKRKLRRNRPPTPPPKETSSSQEFPRHPSWEKADFSPHSLSSVEETRESTRDTAQNARAVSPEGYHRSRKIGQTKPSKGKQNGSGDSPSSSPKRTLSRLNGHVTHKTGSHRDHVIHSSA